MAFTAQVVIFDVIAYTGVDVFVPDELNPSGYDVIALTIEVLEAAAADAAITTIQFRSTNWAILAGGTSIFTTGVLSNGNTACLNSNNGGLISPKDGFQAALAGAPTNCRFRATLQKASGGGQGQR